MHVIRKGIGQIAPLVAGEITEEIAVHVAEEMAVEITLRTKDHATVGTTSRTIRQVIPQAGEGTFAKAT